MRAAAQLDADDRARVEIRRATADDRGALRSLFERLSVEDRYTRFFSPFEPDDEFLDHLATANEQGACQLVAILADDGQPDEAVGEASAWPLANGNGELGITVRSDCRGWLGKQLFAALVSACAEQGFPMLEAEVLMTNRPMIGLLRPRGYAAVGHDAYRSARLVMSTRHRTPDWAAGDPRPRVLVEAPGARWDGEEALRSQGVQVMVCPGPRGGADLPCPALTGAPCALAAGADAIVVHLGDALDAELCAAHAGVHAGVPVRVHPGGANVFEIAEQARDAANEHHG